jgi:hypothetical protein
MSGPQVSVPAPDEAKEAKEEAPRSWKLITLFIFAVCAFGFLLLITRLDPNPSQTNWYIYLTLLALAAAGAAALLPGAINVEINRWLKATGALGVLAVVFYFGASKATPVPSSFVMNTFLVFDSSAPGSPFDSDVYIFANSKVVKADVVPSHRAVFPLQDPSRDATIKVTRTKEAGFRIDFGKLTAGDQIYVIVDSPTGRWRSNDIVIPEGQLSMSPISQQ